MTSENELWKDRAVLVVDDSPTSTTLIRELLRTLPVDVDTAASAEEFESRVRERDYDLILLDYRLPDGNGVELLRDFRSRCLSTAVVLVTGKADLHTATDALSHGADGYVDKRHLRQGPAAFVSTLERALSQRERVLAQIELQGLKDEFHALITHDLRTPAACASVALSMYRDDPQEEVLETAIRSLDRLFERLDRYLDYTRMDSLSWKMSLRTCDLLELLDDTVTDLRPLAESKQQRIVWPSPSTSWTMGIDRLWMSRALENVIGNAIKFTPPGGEIRIETREEQGGLVLEIADTGPGISPDLQPRLFQRFFRAGQTAAKGTGLGLLIVKNVVEGHGGRVEVRSSAAGGAVFRLVFSRYSSSLS